MHPYNNIRHEFKLPSKNPATQETKSSREQEARATQASEDKVVRSTTSIILVRAPGKTESPVKLGKEALKNLRYAQASMKDTTKDGIAVAQMAINMAKTGYDRKYPINVVIMPAGPADSPLKPQETGKLVAFDTRRTKAARIAAKALSNNDFFAYARLKNHSEPAEQEYESLRHLTFENKLIPQKIRKIWILEWDKWHDKRLLDGYGITPKTWGHLIKLRMAMSMDKFRSNQAKTHAGFKESPFLRKTKKDPQPSETSTARRNLF